VRAIIVGAGIAGQAAALRLRRSGWDCLLVERAPARRDTGYAVTFGGIGYDAAERMGILPALTGRSFVTTELVYHRPDGSRRFALSRDVIAAMMGRRSMTILRGDIESVLHDAIKDEVDIRFGATVTAIDQDEHSVAVSLTDDTVERADLLIGADGLHSSVRALAFGPEERYRRDLHHFVAAYSLPGPPPGLPPGATGTLTHRGRTVAAISVGDGRSVAFFGFRARHAAGLSLADPRAVLRRVFAGMGWIVPSLLRDLDAAGSVYFDSVSQIVAPTWTRGRVVLLGDAAWCVTLFAGYGAALAVGGAGRLGDTLGTHGNDLGRALSEWEAGLRPEVRAKQRLARRVEGVYAPENSVALFLYQLPLRVASLAPVQRYIGRRYIQG
jgi:2-polyprenyl-6-methoxyphenol hydroxylase-like FAD-dependent oxidoreductase